MNTPEPIRVLIVDDSRIFRRMMLSVLEEIPGVEVVGSVFSGESALEFIAKSPPDLVTLDIAMPGINGLDTLREITKRNVQAKPLPPVDTILVSALTKAGSVIAVESLQLGALDFVCKPNASSEAANRDELHRSMEQKLAVVRQRRFGMRRHGRPEVNPRPTATATATATATMPRRHEHCRAIAIGTSTGGPEALGLLLPSLVPRCHAPIFIVQHILDGLSGYLAESLSRKCGRHVVEAEHDLVVQPSGIYLAKSGHHMVVRVDDGVARIGLLDSPPEIGCRPAVNVFLRSAAIVYGSRLVTAILTGMGEDGADGARIVKRAGGYVIAQDEASSVVWGMPRAATNSGAVDQVLPLSKISDRLVGLVTAGATL